MQYQVSVKKPLIAAPIELPTSKSISNRVLILNALAYSSHDIKNLSDSDDTRVLLAALNSNSNKFDIGAAGTSMRFLTAFLSKIVGEWEITGSERMKQRPIGILVNALRELGAIIEYKEKEGYPPLKITGCALKGCKLTLAGDISSQYISAILMIAPTIQGGLTIELTGDIISRPYIYLTLKLMEEFGVKSNWTNNLIEIPQASYKPIEVIVEGDWSAASYWYEIMALGNIPTIELIGLHKNSSQGDSALADLFVSLGVDTIFTENGVRLNKTSTLTKQFDYDFTSQPDLAQTFAVTCCLLNIPFHFTGLKTLRIKETDRIYALIDELKKLGYLLTTNGIDTLTWVGEKMGNNPTPAAIDTYHDHRMAMAFAPVAITQQNIIINDPSVITKSYPEFWNDLKKVGFEINQKN